MHSGPDHDSRDCNVYLGETLTCSKMALRSALGMSGRCGAAEPRAA